jgi:opacity protein-like surface antigen
MRLIKVCSAVTVLLLAGFATPASAGAQAIAMLGLSAGAAVPMGKLSDTHTTGFNAMLSLGFGGGEEIPVSLRFDGAYTKFNGSTTNGTTVNGIRIWSGNVNAIVSVPGGEVIRPYVLGGGGVFNMKSSAANSSSSTDFGLTGGVGVGLDLSGFNTFAEARIHHIFTANGATRFAPIVFGILF